MMKRQVVSVIGLGRMGLPMALNLAKTFEVIGYDKTHSVAQSSIKVAKSVTEAFSDTQVIVTALPRASDVEKIMAEGLSAAKAGTLLIDCTTVSTCFAKRLGDIANERELLAVDAPMSGGVPAAEKGTLTFMVGGSEEAFNASKPYLEAMGSRLFHAGPKGAGASAKLCNNLILASQMIAVAEGFALAEKLDLDANSLYEIASNATAKSWSLNEYPPVKGVGTQTSPANSDFRPGFSAALMLKDLSIARQAATDVSSPTPLSNRAFELYHYMVNHADLGHLDFSAIITLLQSNRRGTLPLSDLKKTS